MTSDRTLTGLLQERRPTDGGQVFVRTPEGRTWSYDQIDALAAQLTNVVRAHGVRTGDRVAVQSPNSVEWLALHLGLLRAGAVQLPLNPAYTDAEVAALLYDAEPTLVVRDTAREVLPGPWAHLTLDASGHGSLLDEASAQSVEADGAELSGDSPAALLYTSGTTGRPKGALLSHGNLWHNATTLVAAWGFGPDDVLLHMLPLFHTHGLFVATHCVLASGSSMVALPRFDARAVVTQLPSATVLMAVPTHYTRLLAEPDFDRDAVAGIRLFTSGSAPMTVGLHNAVTARTGHVVLERYGMTETAMLTSNPLRGQRRPGTVGPPLPGVDVRVVDDEDIAVALGEVGNVQVQGPNVFSGYWRRPDLRQTEFTAEGYFRTGDLGRFHPQRYLELVGRSKDLIISGGMNVHPKEVEEALDAIEGVAESAVIGLPDSDLGEAVVAVVVASDGAVLDAETVRHAVRDRLAGFKVPKRVYVVAALPRNAMGKVEKARIRNELSRESR